MTAPRVSFILPIYNAGKYLRDTLDSIAQQTSSDFEVIAINDGSTDETNSILRDYQGLPLKIVDRENRGLVESLNETVELAQGEYLARIDADDLCVPERLAVQTQFLDTHQDVAVVGSAAETFPNGTIVKYPENPAATLLFRSAVAHPAVMMRKSVLDRYKLRYRQPFRCAQDYDLWCRCVALRIQIRNLPEVLLKYRLHAAQITQEFAEPTQLEGVVIRSQLLRDLELGATEEEIALHNTIARNQLVPTEVFVAAAARWLTFLGTAEKRRAFFDRVELMQVLTGRFVAVCRFAMANGLAMPEAGIFRDYLHADALERR